MTIEEIFPDEVLAIIVAKKLGLNECDEVTNEQLLSIEDLDCFERDIPGWEGYDDEICSIEGIQKLKNLTMLEFAENQIEDISPLANLKKLRTLELHYNEISDVSPLFGLKSLRRLNLANNNLINVSPLLSMKNLESLDLSGNNLENKKELESIVDSRNKGITEAVKRFTFRIEEI